MADDRTVALVIGPTRSGTSAMRMALNGHPEAVVMGEILPVSAFNPVKGLKTRYSDPQPAHTEPAFALRLEDPMRYLEVYCFSCTRRVVGFKMVYPQVLSVDFAATVLQVLGRRDVKVVSTWRRDLPARFRSQMLKYREARLPYLERIEAHLSVPYVIQDCLNQIAMKHLVAHILGDVPRIEVWQEDLERDPHTVMARVQTFLGLDPVAIEVEPRPPGTDCEFTRRLDDMLADARLDPFRCHDGRSFPAAHPTVSWMA